MHSDLCMWLFISIGSKFFSSYCFWFFRGQWKLKFWCKDDVWSKAGIRLLQTSKMTIEQMIYPGQVTFAGNHGHSQKQILRNKYKPPMLPQLTKIHFKYSYPMCVTFKTNYFVMFVLNLVMVFWTNTRAP